MRCFCCGGPFHPATGDYDRRFDVATCGACYRPWLTWFKSHTRQRRRGRDFYAEAATSIRADAGVQALEWPPIDTSSSKIDAEFVCLDESNLAAVWEAFRVSVDELSEVGVLRDARNSVVRG